MIKGNIGCHSRAGLGALPVRHLMFSTPLAHWVSSLKGTPSVGFPKNHRVPVKVQAASRQFFSQHVQSLWCNGEGLGVALTHFSEKLSFRRDTTCFFEGNPSGFGTATGANGIHPFLGGP